ncbi:hypothetical protein K230099C4_11800 [Parabacteroides merdae]
MVAKISTGGNMFGALAYNQNKVDSEEAKVLFSNRMLLGEDGNFSIGECMRSFEIQMPVQLSTKKPILHISINPHPEDVLTDQQLSDIAQEYMRKLGYGDQPYLVYKHTDIDRHHIHIVGLRVDENGKPLNDRFEHRRSKQITRELEKKYGLHPAERKERAERPELKKVDYAAGDVKHQIGNTVKAACYGYRFQSFGEYKALLAAYNVCAEEVKGEINGKPYQGIVYSAMNDKGEKAGNPVKASRIGKSVGYEAVQRRMEKSGEAIKNGKLKERTRKIVATVMQTARSRKELEQQLRKQGIDVVFRQNDSGRIYGVTFIDHDSRVVLNGSRLGKEYSANVFNERFSGETGKMHQSEVDVYDGQLLIKVLNLSVWSMLHAFISVVPWFLFFVAIEHLGKTELAISNITRSVSAIFFVIANSFAVTTGSLVSNAIGARARNELFPICHKVLKLGYAVGIPFVVVALLCNRWIVSFYTDNELLIELAFAPFVVMLLNYTFALPGYVYLNAVGGTGKTKITFLFQVTTTCVYLVYLYWLSFCIKASLSLYLTAEYLFVILLALQSIIHLKSKHY